MGKIKERWLSVWKLQLENAIFQHVSLSQRDKVVLAAMVRSVCSTKESIARKKLICRQRLPLLAFNSGFYEKTVRMALESLQRAGHIELLNNSKSKPLVFTINYADFNMVCPLWDDDDDE